jgi:hypothetical protein
MKKIKPHIYWKKKYDYLRAEIQEVHEKANLFQDSDRRLFPKTCISASKVFWITNDMEVFDSEEIAKSHSGEGNYFKVKRIKNDSRE